MIHFLFYKKQKISAKAQARCSWYFADLRCLIKMFLILFVNSTFNSEAGIISSSKFLSYFVTILSLDVVINQFL